MLSSGFQSLTRASSYLKEAIELALVSSLANLHSSPALHDLVHLALLLTGYDLEGATFLYVCASHPLTENFLQRAAYDMLQKARLDSCSFFS
jgi:hypothetical protein